MPRTISKISSGVFLTLFVAGVITGLFMYIGRSSDIEAHHPDANAITAHLILAALFVISLIAARMYWSKKHGRQSLLLLKPFSKTAYVRFRRTVTLSSGVSFVTILRFIATCVLTVMLAYNFFRAGAQVFGALDPNFTVNAWGGPGYWGASLAHWLDAAILFYIEALLLSKVMLPQKPEDKR